MVFCLQKINKKMHLSKVKHSKFDESAQLAAFYAASVIAGADIIYNVRTSFVVHVKIVTQMVPFILIARCVSIHLACSDENVCLHIIQTCFDSYFAGKLCDEYWSALGRLSTCEAAILHQILFYISSTFTGCC